MMSVSFSVDVYRCKEGCGVFVYVNKDCNCACPYSVIINVLNVLSSTRPVGEAPFLVKQSLNWYFSSTYLSPTCFCSQSCLIVAIFTLGSLSVVKAKESVTS